MSKSNTKKIEKNNKLKKNNLCPHDRFTRSAMGNHKVAEEFFQHNLPDHIKKAIDFSSIQLQKESFIDDKLKLQIADLLYSVDFNGTPGFLYILFEHTSSAQPLLPFRMLKYMVAIMDAHLTKNSNSEENKTLPLIYPIILYNGERPYNYSMDLFDLFPTKEKELAKDMLLSPYHLIDLTQVSDEELQKYIWFGSMALVLKHIHDSDILPFIKEILCIVKELEKYGAESYIFSMVTYIAEAGELPRQEDWAGAIQDLESIDKEKLMTLMNLVERLQPEINKRILEKGRQEGLEKGRHERDIEIAKALLLQEVNIETIAVATSLSKEEIKKLLS